MKKYSREICCIIIIITIVIFFVIIVNIIIIIIINSFSIIIIIAKIKTDLPTSAIPILPAPATESQIFTLPSFLIPVAVANLINIDFYS